MTDQELLQAIGQVVENAVESKLEPVRQDIHELKEQVGRVEQRIDRLESKVDSLEKRMDRLESKVDSLEKRMDRLESKVDSLEKRMDRLESKVDQLESRIDGLETRVVSLEPQMTGIRVYMDTELDRTLKLLLEGQQALWDRFVPYEEFNPLEGRTEVLELTVKRHSQEIRELQPPA